MRCLHCLILLVTMHFCTAIGMPKTVEAPGPSWTTCGEYTHTCLYIYIYIDTVHIDTYTNNVSTTKKTLVEYLIPQKHQPIYSEGLTCVLRCAELQLIPLHFSCLSLASPSMIEVQMGWNRHVAASPESMCMSIIKTTYSVRVHVSKTNNH